MRAGLAFILLLTIQGGIGCLYLKRSGQEDGLRQALSVLRSEIAQFTADHQRGPAFLEDLVASGYLKEIPIDPITGRNDTWTIETVGDEWAWGMSAIVNVHSGSASLDSDGRPYSSW